MGPGTDLSGQWRTALADEKLRRRFPSPDFDDSTWDKAAVPGHWRDVPAFAHSDGPVLYRRGFEHGLLAGGRRAWLVVEGIFYQSYLWLDGSYLGDTEGYFFPHTFEVTELLASRSEHVLGAEVSCPRPVDYSAKTALTGVFGEWDCIDRSYNPGGIWAPVRVVVTGPVRIASLRVTCRSANAQKAVLDLVAVLDSSSAGVAHVSARLAGAEGAQVARLERDQPVAQGPNRAHWQLEVPGPRLWWPRSLGPADLYDLTLDVSADGELSDHRHLRTGLRSVHMRDFVWRVNGERIFLKGANLAPTDRGLARASAAQVARDVWAAADAGLDLLRVHGHVGRPELYEAADEAGVLIWQDMPLQWRYGNVRQEAVRQASAAVDLLAHHPSLLVWCAHNEPFSVEVPGPGLRERARALSLLLRGQVLPNRDKSWLDRGVRRALRRADPTRPVLVHSGLLGRLAAASDTHLYFGWYYGEMGGLPKALRIWPALGRFVGELGAQAVPTEAAFMAPDRWPRLDWPGLEAHNCLQKPIFDRLVPPARFSTFDEWKAASQAYQAALVQLQVEALRRLKYRPCGGFAVFCLNDAQPAVTWSLLGHDRAPKAGWDALVKAARPVLAVATWPSGRLKPGQHVEVEVHVLNDLRQDIDEALVTAEMVWPGGGRRWTFGGRAPADRCTRVGALRAELPGLDELRGHARHTPAELAWLAGEPGWTLYLELTISWEGVPAVVNQYRGSIGPA